MEKLPDGRFRPIKLVSAGLTNNPNIPESGRIIRSIRKTANLEALKSVGGESSDAAKSLRECADGAKRLAKLSREAVVQTRIVLAKKAQQQKPQQQKIPTAKQIAQLAARAASESNQPYVKTFAQLRKKYSVSTKPQTKELNEE